jgi:hypothetical protein
MNYNRIRLMSLLIKTALKINHLVMLILLVLPFNSKSITSDTALIKTHLVRITKTEGYRTAENTILLDKTADYIKNVFSQFADTVYLQSFSANGKIYNNVIASFGTAKPKRIIVGAHYDVCGNQEGADDNASGITGLLELARMLKGEEMKYRIDLVAYTLEEPPHFRTENMGSFIHARSLAENGDDVYGMVSLEMIGYFKDEARTQSYPLGLLSAFYGNRGDYITIVKKFRSGKFARKFSRNFKNFASVKTKKFSAPRALPGIDFSDHLNYWDYGFSALMITDTSFYRNPNYHKPGDTLETLDFYRMARVIDSVYETLLAL